jgi:excisionase family DNA binding protein
MFGNHDSAGLGGGATMMHEHGYLQVRDAARYLGVSPSTLRNWERLGKIAAHRHPVNNYRLFKRADLDALLQEIERSRRDLSVCDVPNQQGQESLGPEEN